MSEDRFLPPDLGDFDPKQANAELEDANRNVMLGLEQEDPECPNLVAQVKPCLKGQRAVFQRNYICFKSLIHNFFGENIGISLENQCFD
jgi:hypothetical protein